MFFLLSKTLYYLVMPLTIVVGCYLLSVLLRPLVWRRRIGIAGLVLLFFFTNDFVANEVMKAWEEDARPYAGMRKYRLGVVLTGTVIPELAPDDRVYFAKGADRVIHTVQLYKLGIIERILVSGGSGRLVDVSEREADRFREVMLFMGIPDSAIYIENVSRNTHESAVAVRDILDELGYASEDCLLITSAFHMRRSMACFRHEGMAPDSFAVDYYAHGGTYYLDSFVVPKLEALVIWHKLVKEWVGFVAYWIAGYV